MTSIHILDKISLLMLVYSILQLGSHHWIRNINLLRQEKNDKINHKTSAWKTEKTDHFKTLTLNSAKMSLTSSNLDFADVPEPGSKVSAFLRQDNALINNVTKE